MKTLISLNHCLRHCALSGACLVVSGGVWSMSGGVWWRLMHVWWCLPDSGDVNVYRLIWPDLIDVYGQISLPVHLTDAAKMLMR